ncbi:MAG: hypothetical protein AAFQ43_13110 [Bacteroidota bacterium]
MADLSTKNDPLHLRQERPDYVQDRVGIGNRPDTSDDLSEEQPPDVNRGPQDPGSLGIEKPTMHVDMEKVREAEREGKGM